MVKKSPLSLVIGGLVLGVALNWYVSLLFVDKVFLDWVISCVFVGTAMMLQFLISEYMKGNKELGIGTKVRLTFFGMSEHRLVMLCLTFGIFSMVQVSLLSHF